MARLDCDFQEDENAMRVALFVVSRANIAWKYFMFQRCSGGVFASVF